MKTLKISLKNIFRNKRRTIITLSAIIFGNIGIIVFGGFLEYNFWGLRETTIRGALGHIQITKTGYLDSGKTNVLGYTIDNYQEIKSVIENELINEQTGLPFAEVVTPQILFNGILGTGKNTSVCTVKGVEPEYDPILSAVDIVRKGYDLSVADPLGGVIGKGIANGLSANVDDYLTLLISTPQGGLNAVDFKIRGVFESGIKEYDDSVIKIPLPLSQELLGTTDVTKILLLLDKTENTALVAEKLKALKQKYDWDIEIQTWDEMATMYHQVVRLQSTIYGIIKLIIAIIVIFSIANTISMSVMERINEIGTIRAIGGTRGYISRLFLCEGLWIGIMGGVLGIAFSLLVIKLINIHGISMPPPPGNTRGYIAYILIDEESIRFSFLLSVLTAFISSILPAIRASRIEINDALRSV